MRTVQKEVKEILKQLSLETGLDYQLVEDIYHHEFLFVTRQMAKGEKGEYPTFENILIKHLGSFVANEKHINKLKEIHEKGETSL